MNNRVNIQEFQSLRMFFIHISVVWYKCCTVLRTKGKEEMGRL